ncbi:hypothetical protein Ndes2437A_g02202 [Nannochloris sp. 'desiccata']
MQFQERLRARMNFSPAGGGNPEADLNEDQIENDILSKADVLAKISALPSGPAYGDQNFGGDPEKGSTRGSYDANSVVLTLEFLSDSGTKFLVFLLRISMLLSLILLFLQLWWKLANDVDTLAYNDTMLVINLVVAIASVLLLLLAGGFYLFGIYKVRKENKRWNARRRRYCILGGLNLLFQFISSGFFLISNAYGLAQPCSWFLLNIQVLSFFRWTAFTALLAMQILQALTLLPIDSLPWYKGNVHVGLDLPSKVYAYVFFAFFAPLEILQFVRFGVASSWFDSAYLCQTFYSTSCEVIDFSAECKEKKYPCYYSKGARILATVSAVLFAFTFLVYFAMILFSRRQLRKLPYQEHRISIIELGFQLETRLIAAILYVFSLVVFSLVRPSTCGSLILNSMGDAPMQIVYAVVILFQAVLATPAVQFKASKIKLHAWLQDFAWLESDVAPKLAARPFHGEPCFCFETSLKMFYYCNLIYDLDEVPDSPYTLDVALGLYDLTHHRILFHQKQDAKCFAAWNPETRTIVFSFRGTASMANVLADIKVWRRPHPPTRGQYYLNNQPMVHVGFLETWEDSGMKNEVLALLHDVMNGGNGVENIGDSNDGDGTKGASAAASGSADPPPSQAPWRVLVTGHSLGGALAHLCSHDICSTFGDRARLTCTTFGAPRPGNHAFASSFRETVHDAWDIFHPNDAVARAGKFILLYKRAAHTVIISPAGELVVRPTQAEASVRRGFSRLADHLLTTYAHSLGAILKAAMHHDGQVYLRNEARPVLEIDPSKGETTRVTSTQEALKELFARDYVQKFMTFERAIRQDSLLRMAGAPSSVNERARLQLLQEEEDVTAAAVNNDRRLNCGNCLNAGIVLSWLPSLENLKGVFGRRKSDMELHVQD